MSDATISNSTSDDDSEENVRTHTSDEVIEYEFEKLNITKHSKKYGLSLSGGGIRSASFSIGVLQALHTTSKYNLLDKIHYLSTVSGGGYSGTAFSWFRTKFRNNPKSWLRAEKN